MKNAEFNLAAFLNCCLLEKNNLFTETLLKKAFMTFESKNNTFCLFLRTRGKTRLILRSQVFEIQIVLDQKDLLGVSKCVCYNSLTRKLFEIRFYNLTRFKQ